MVPLRWFDVEVVDGRVVPRWLGPDDERWVADALAAVASAAGQPASAMHDVFREQLLPVSRAHAVTPRMLGAVSLLERKRWTTRTSAPASPEQVRDTVFELAARLPRSEALGETAKIFGVTPAEIEQSLFADRREARILTPPVIPTEPGEMIARYNTELVAVLLARSVEVTATITGDLRPIAARAKRDGLVVQFEENDGVSRATVSGALALFRDTVKYGAALARFVPVVARTPGWKLAARVALPDGGALFELDGTAPPFAGPPVPEPASRDVLRHLARDLAGSGWNVDACDDVVRCGGRLFFPDVALVRDHTRVLVEVIATRSVEHVAWSRAVLDGAAVPVVLCVDEAALHGPPPIHPGIVPFRRVIDASMLASACDSAARRGRSRLPEARAPA